MNQFLLDSRLVSGSDEQSRCAEQVLRIALFSRLETQEESLLERRCEVANETRTHRRGGMVPILFGLVWFIFILGLSIRNTFDNVSENAAGYNLGMGFAVSWITPLVIGALVDRNAIATKDLRSNLNWIFAGALEALRSLHGEYSKVFNVDGLPKGSHIHFDDKLLELLPENLLAEFAGQGRLRWHRGVAHAILTGLEKSYAAEHGRGWLDNGELARAAVLIPYGDKGFDVMDGRLFLQAIAAFGIIYGNLGAGFLISYFTPPVGISCRAFGYLLFGTSTLAAAMIEVILGSATSPASEARRIGSYGLLTLEALNVCWLLSTILAQTFGFYQTCFCLNTRFDGKLGYIQFDNVEINHSDLTITVWSISAGVAGTILLSSLAYFVIEWLEHCHMNTYDVMNAQRGLLWSRRFKKVRGWLFFVLMLPVNGLFKLCRLVGPRKYARRKLMVWSS
ncbi:hypothetical protein MBLNU13_g06787t2 [Cladosporium sp. NU13]